MHMLVGLQSSHSGSFSLTSVEKSFSLRLFFWDVNEAIDKSEEDSPHLKQDCALL